MVKQQLSDPLWMFGPMKIDTTLWEGGAACYRGLAILKAWFRRLVA